MKCKFCGGNRFIGHQTAYHDIIVDGDANFEEDISCYDSDNPYGPFACAACGAEYEKLTDMEDFNEKPAAESVKRTVDDMCHRLTKMKEESPFLMEMAKVIDLMQSEGVYDFEQAYILAMALFHPNGITVGDSTMLAAEEVEALTFLPPNVLPKDVVDCVFMGSKTFNRIVQDLVEYKRGSNAFDWEKAQFYQEAVCHAIVDIFSSQKAQDHIKEEKMRYQASGFIWVKKS